MTLLRSDSHSASGFIRTGGSKRLGDTSNTGTKVCSTKPASHVPGGDKGFHDAIRGAIRPSWSRPTHMLAADRIASGKGRGRIVRAALPAPFNPYHGTMSPTTPESTASPRPRPDAI